MKLEDIFQHNQILSNYSSKELKDYAQTFFTEKEERLGNLIDNISSDMKIDKSELDFSEDSLKIVDRWLINNINTVKLSKEEYEAKRNSTPDYIDIVDWKLDFQTCSNIINIGMYLGETMIHKYPSLKWEQHKKGSKRNIDYGHMIIKLGEQHFTEFNPIWLIDVICWKIAKTRDNIILETFKTWDKMKRPHTP